MGADESIPQREEAPRKCLLITDADIKELRTLHTHIHVASPEMQKRAACLLANLAENDQNQETIVSEGGLGLLVPLMESKDREVQRLSVHTIANLSVNAKNRHPIVEADSLPALVSMLSSPSSEIQRQSSKALANLAVDVEEKAAVVAAGALPPLIELMTKRDEPGVQLEAIAAVGNLAVNDANELLIVELGALDVLNEALKSPNVDCVRQATRTIANLTVSPINKERAHPLLDTLLELSKTSGDPLVKKQACRGIANIMEK